MKGPDSYSEFPTASFETLEHLAALAEFRNSGSTRHIHWVGEMSARVAEQLGLPAEQVSLLRMAARLHDVGKIGIPDSILLKTEPPSPEEWITLKNHTLLGAQILSVGRSPVLQMARVIALSHHESWDGSGYPHGLAGEQIPLVARIVRVVDCFDALVSERPYKAAWPLQRVVAEIQAESGRKFDPRIARALLQICP